MVEFYTKDATQFIVTSDKIYRNGEVVIQGNIHIHHLILNEPAWIDVQQGDNKPPIFLKLDKVSAVLPSQEFFNGVRCHRNAYQVSFYVHKTEGWVMKKEVLSAVNDMHVRQILKAKHGRDIRSVSSELLQSKTELSITN
ncbi:hypothetical protein [Cytobacillus firmus]|uniref:Uncharacterized protein n=1 Tax=Cytobacillus firmus TaxID=1399 RepID=A0AA46P6F9_CYTFI|nr:hypothetical protein [Cytobacillus firmus]UYG98216.1 hypothetical protein OD459_25435 [Cytobacillus firmus]